MIDLTKDLGVQSYTFRAFKDIDALIKCAKDSGVSKIALCGVHVDFQDTAKFDDIVAKFNDAGVDIVSIGVQGIANNEAQERNYFEFCKKAGCNVMSVDFKIDAIPDCFETGQKLADEYDVNLAIHNHGGRHWLGSRAVLAKVFEKTGPRVGLSLDTAWALDSHEDPIQMAEQFADRLYGLHIKDFVFDRAGKPEDVVVGTGNLQLKSLVDVLKQKGFDGYAVLEYEGDVENPVPAVQKCVQAVREAAK